MKTCPSCQRTFDDNLRFCQNDGTELIADDPFKTMIAGQPLTPSAPENDPLEIPDFDPNKTSVFSAQDQVDVLSTPDPFAGLPQPEPEPFIPPPPPVDAYAPPSFDPQPIPPPPSPSFGAEPEQVYQPQPSPFDSPFSPPQQDAGAGDWQAPPAPMQQWGDQQAGFGSNTPFQPPGAVAGQSKGLAIAALVCGILSIPCCWLAILLGPAGAIMGWIAKNKADQDPMNYGGRGMAMAGLITGIIGTIIAILWIVLNVLGIALGGLR